MKEIQPVQTGYGRINTLAGGLTFENEPQILRFFFGKLVLTSDWHNKLVETFKQDMGDSL